MGYKQEEATVSSRETRRDLLPVKHLRASGYSPGWGLQEAPGIQNFRKAEFSAPGARLKPISRGGGDLTVTSGR